MFKRITFVFIAVLVSLSAKAQFHIEDDTLYTYGFAGMTSSDFVDIEAETKIHHLSSTPEIIKWVRTENQLPSTDWTSAVCDIISCRSADTDTGSFLFNGNDSGNLYFHFYTKNVNASGKMVVRFSRASDPLQYRDVVTFITAWKPVGINSLTASTTRSFPNPAKNEVTFSNDRIDAGRIEIYNAIGQVVSQKDFTNNMTVDIRDFAPGVYTVKISNTEYSSVSRIVKQ
jgi:hypothetical protein